MVQETIENSAGKTQPRLAAGVIDAALSGVSIRRIADAASGGSIVRLIEAFERDGGIEQARRTVRGCEEMIRVGVESLKIRALETLESIAAGGYASSSLELDYGRYRALELTRRTCTSILKLNPFPTRRDSYQDERGPRIGENRRDAEAAQSDRGALRLFNPAPLSEGLGEGAQRSKRDERAQDVVSAGARTHAASGCHGESAGDTFGRNVSHGQNAPATEDAPRDPLAPGSARGSNVMGHASAQRRADDSMGDTNNRTTCHHRSLTLPSPDPDPSIETREIGPPALGSDARDQGRSLNRAARRRLERRCRIEAKRGRRALNRESARSPNAANTRAHGAMPPNMVRGSSPPERLPARNAVAVLDDAHPP